MRPLPLNPSQLKGAAKKRVPASPNLGSLEPPTPAGSTRISRVIVNKKKKQALPFKTFVPRPKVIAKKTNKYDAQALYFHLGTALKAASASRQLFRRIALTINDFDLHKNRQAQSLLEKINRTMVSVVELERMLIKFEFGAAKVENGLVRDALKFSRETLNNFSQMLDAHIEQDQEELMPLLSQLKTIAAQLERIKDSKVAAVTKLEETYDKTRRAYWNEQTKENVRKANATRPVKRLKQPYPVNEIAVDPVPLDPALLAKRAQAEIIEAEKSKAAAKKPISDV